MHLPDNFNQEEITLHRAVQLISLTGVNLLDTLPDDSQNTAVWDKESSAILGRSFDLNNTYYRIGIRLTPFELVLIDSNSNLVNSMEIGGLDKSALYSIWADWINSLGFHGELKTKLHYDLPENEHYRSNQFDGLTIEFANTWYELRSVANVALEQLNKVSGINSEINIWPHHFDTGVYYSISEKNGETVQSIGAGLGIADSLINEPYLYLYGWTKEGSIDYGNVPKIENGVWLTEGWQGAVLKISDANTIEGINDFFKFSYQFIYNQLKNIAI
jgi:hypothetical protein